MVDRLAREGPNGKESKTTVHLDATGHQTSDDQLELPLEGRGEALSRERSGEVVAATYGDARSGIDGGSGVMEQIIERGNLMRALKRVQRNQGSPGVDGRTVEDLPADLKRDWLVIREQLLSGRYQPSAVSPGVRRGASNAPGLTKIALADYNPALFRAAAI